MSRAITSAFSARAITPAITLALGDRTAENPTGIDALKQIATFDDFHTLRAADLPSFNFRAAVNLYGMRDDSGNYAPASNQQTAPVVTNDGNGVLRWTDLGQVKESWCDTVDDDSDTGIRGNFNQVLRMVFRVEDNTLTGIMCSLGASGETAPPEYQFQAKCAAGRAWEFFEDVAVNRDCLFRDPDGAWQNGDWVYLVYVHEDTGSQKRVSVWGMYGRGSTVTEFRSFDWLSDTAMTNGSDATGTYTAGNENGNGNGGDSSVLYFGGQTAVSAAWVQLNRGWTGTRADLFVAEKAIADGLVGRGTMV